MKDKTKLSNNHDDGYQPGVFVGASLEITNSPLFVVVTIGILPLIVL